MREHPLAEGAITRASSRMLIQALEDLRRMERQEEEERRRRFETMFPEVLGIVTHRVTREQRERHQVIENQRSRNNPLIQVLSDGEPSTSGVGPCTTPVQNPTANRDTKEEDFRSVDEKH